MMTMMMIKCQTCSRDSRRRFVRARSVVALIVLTLSVMRQGIVPIVSSFISINQSAQAKVYILLVSFIVWIEYYIDLLKPASVRPSGTEVTVGTRSDQALNHIVRHQSRHPSVSSNLKNPPVKAQSNNKLSHHTYIC
jgi:hypothetical protein